MQKINPTDPNATNPFSWPEVQDPTAWRRLVAYETHAQTLNLVLVWTYRCNLRCEHCNVSHLLVKDDRIEFEIEDFVAYAKMVAQGKKIVLTVIGGEPLVDTEGLARLFEHPEVQSWEKTMVTNLTILSGRWMDVLSKLDAGLLVSVDGCPEDHDANRGKGRFATTYKNIRAVRQALPNLRVSISTALSNERFDDVMYLARFYGLMAYVGIAREDVRLTVFSPGGKHQDNLSGVSYAGQMSFYAGDPCCGYRFMQSFSITPDGRVWTNYYGPSNKTHLIGHVSDKNIEEVRSRYAATVSAAHFVRDPVCRSCEALSYCWGLKCVNNQQYGYVPPSTLCDREKIIERFRSSRLLRAQALPEPSHPGCESQAQLATGALRHGTQGQA